VIYEYKCSHCDLIFEVQQKMSDPPPTRCPDEAGHVDSAAVYNLERVISRTSFQLKGSGFYTTDYKRKGQNNGTV